MGNDILQYLNESKEQTINDNLLINIGINISKNKFPKDTMNYEFGLKKILKYLI